MPTNTSSTDRLVSPYIRAKLEEKGITQLAAAHAIGRNAQSYISDRLACKKSWSLKELDVIAQLIGLPSALTLIAAASGFTNQDR